MSFDQNPLKYQYEIDGSDVKEIISDKLTARRPFLEDFLEFFLFFRNVFEFIFEKFIN
jgi:hypothetical protein